MIATEVNGWQCVEVVDLLSMNSWLDAWTVLVVALNPWMITVGLQLFNNQKTPV